MFSKRIKLFELHGFAVHIDLSWAIIAILVVWSLATSLFPSRLEGLSTRAYWFMGIVGALLFFASIVFHEFCHSAVAQRFGLPMKGITLFLFGGVAEMEEEPQNPRAEFFMAVAGPAASLVLAAAFWALSAASSPLWSPVGLVFGYLATINLILAVFNLAPAFPLDGGRILRSILWKWKGNLRWATRMGSQAGVAFGGLLIAFGVLRVVATGVLFAGLWPALLGLFLMSAARGSYQQLLVRRALEGEPVSRFMSTDPVTVSPDLTVEQVIEEYVYKHHFKLFPVLDDGRLAGIITTRELREVPREEWGARTVGEVLRPLDEVPTLSPDADAMKALSTMSRDSLSRMVVARGEELIGVISLKDLLHFLSLKVELEDEGDARRVMAGLTGQPEEGRS